TDVDLSDLSGLDFSDAKASNESKKAAKDKQNDTADDVDLNDISGLDFSQTSHDKKRGDKGE
ncbi:PTS galactitol transporter subunit IIC, partial [Lacticaseibacillus paracasei]